MVCVVQGCDRTDIKGGQMCKMHYERNRRNGDPLVDGRALFAERRRAASRAVAALEEKKCNICKEVKPLSEYYKRGDWTYTWCKQCHRDRNDANRIRKRLENPPKPKVKVDHGQCAFEGCTNKARVQLKNGPEGWYCAGHWQQDNLGKELTPLQAQVQSFIDERFRRCTSCLKVKTHEQFHDRAHNAGKQSECKECMYKRVVFNKSLREDRLDDAVSIFGTMPKVMQDKLEWRLVEAQGA